jgi:hypothetical protein
MISTALTAILLANQDPMIPVHPKAELEAISYLTGKYKGKGEGHDQAGKVIKATGGSSGKMEFSHWLNLESSYNMDGMNLEGRLMLTYNVAKKQYEGTWFDNMSQYGMNCRGYTEGKYLVLMSDPVDMGPDMPPTKFKIVYSKESNRTYKFSLKMNMGEQWMPAMSMTYSK